jgi:hypothetical protein
LKTIQIAVTESAQDVRFRACIKVAGAFLPEYGFNEGSFVKIIPNSDGIDFVSLEEPSNQYNEMRLGDFETNNSLCSNLKSRQVFTNQYKELFFDISKPSATYCYNFIYHTDSYSQCNENFDISENKEEHLTRVSFAKKDRDGVPAIYLSGRLLYDLYFDVGDELVARIEHGLIQIRRIKILNKGYVPGKIFVDEVGRYVSKLELSGEWMNEFGFTPGALVLVSVCRKGVDFSLRDERPDEYQQLYEYVEKHGYKLLRVQNFVDPDNVYVSELDNAPCIEFDVTSFDDVELDADDVYSIYAEAGSIYVRKLDYELLGFRVG